MAHMVSLLGFVDMCSMVFLWNPMGSGPAGGGPVEMDTRAAMEQQHGGKSAGAVPGPLFGGADDAKSI